MVHPDAWPLIDAWAADRDFWVRRSALLTLLQAIGWVLRETEQAYRTAVDQAGRASLLRQVFAQAAALGPQLNIFTGGIATASAFVGYTPARYLRPFNLFPW